MYRGHRGRYRARIFNRVRTIQRKQVAAEADRQAMMEKYRRFGAAMTLQFWWKRKSLWLKLRRLAADWR